MNQGDSYDRKDARALNSSGCKQPGNLRRNGRSSVSSGSESAKTGILADEDCLLTAVDAARLLNLKNVGSIYQMVSHRRIPVVKLSARCIRFSRKALLEWIESMTQSVDSSDIRQRHKQWC
jgi:excisionase family DNA binding protein